MTEVQISVKNVEEEVFREFKAQSVRDRTPVGKALTLAMKVWLVRKRRKPTKSLLDIKPWNWGPGTERLSEEVDEVLYGGDPY